jgi:hypothetical protein
VKGGIAGGRTPVRLISGDLEKRVRKDPPSPYPDLTQVPWLRRPRCIRVTLPKGNRQICSVTSGYAVPGLVQAFLGLSN